MAREISYCRAVELSRIGGGILLLTCLLATGIAAQDGPAPPQVPIGSEDVARITEEEAALQTQRMLGGGLSQEEMSSLHLLALNRGRTVLPILEGFLALQLRGPVSDEDSVTRALDAVAYTASPQGIDILCRLERTDAETARETLRQSLDYAVGRGNPYSLAYRIWDRGSPEAVEVALSWIRSWIARFGATRRGYEDWARAIILRYDEEVNVKELATSDPILSKLYPTGPPVELLRKIDEELERQAHSIRERR